MSLLEQYIKEIEEDCKVDEFNLKSTQFKLPSTKHKWVGRFIRHKQELQKLQKTKEKQSHELAQKFIESAPVKITMVTALKSVEETETIKKLIDEIDELKLIIELLEKVEKIFSSMSFDLKNITEIMKAETM
jgi:Tfp pilus assembly protein PilW